MKNPIFKYTFFKPFIILGFGVFNIGFIYILGTTFYKESIERRKKYKEVESGIKNDVPEEQKDEFIEKILRQYKKND